MGKTIKEKKEKNIYIYIYIRVAKRVALRPKTKDLRKLGKIRKMLKYHRIIT